MLFEQNLLNKSEIKKIITSLEEIREKILTNRIEISEDFEDIHHFFFNSYIEKLNLPITLFVYYLTVY